MSTEAWLTLGIYIASLVFGVVGWLIIREIKINDKKIEKMEVHLDRVREENSHLKNEMRILKMVLRHKGWLPLNLPSPPDHLIDGD